MKHRLMIVTFCVLGGCTGTPSPEEQLIEEAKLSVMDQLKDPESAQFKIENPSVYINSRVVCGDIEVNAKNSYGGYTGFERFIYVDGQSYLESDSLYLENHERCIEEIEAETDRIRARTAEIEQYLNEGK